MLWKPRQCWSLAISILSKPVLPSLADGQFVVASFEQDRHAAFAIALNGGNARDVDDGAAMNLPERFAIEFVEQFFERFANEGLAVGRHHARVFGVGLKIKNFLNRDEFDDVADRCLYPAQLPFRFGGELRNEISQVGRRRTEARIAYSS